MCSVSLSWKDQFYEATKRRNTVDLVYLRLCYWESNVFIEVLSSPEHSHPSQLNQYLEKKTERLTSCVQNNANEKAFNIRRK